MALFDAFLKVEGIDGESLSKGHEKWIEIDSYQWGLSNSLVGASSGGGGAAGKSVPLDFTVTKTIDKASPKLMLACATGQHIPTATLDVVRAGENQQKYLLVKLTDVVISSLNISGQGSGDPVPTEQVSLNFAKIDFTHFAQSTSGGLGEATTASFDFKRQR